MKLLKEKHSDNSLEAKEKKQEEKKQKEKKQKEKKKSKSHEKKKDRREKKAKKDITKNETLTDEKKNGSRKRTVAERSNLDSKCDFYPKTKEGEIEQLERSSLTEELCLPSQYICDSPDSCQNSHKRTKLNTIDVPKITFGIVSIFIIYLIYWIIFCVFIFHYFCDEQVMGFLSDCSCLNEVRICLNNRLWRCFNRGNLLRSLFLQTHRVWHCPRKNNLNKLRLWNNHVCLHLIKVKSSRLV